MSNCQHDPMQQLTTLHVESNGSQSRIRCVTCNRYAMISRNGVLKSPQPSQETVPECHASIKHDGSYGPVTCGVCKMPIPATETIPARMQALNEQYKDRPRGDDGGELTPRMDETLLETPAECEHDGYRTCRKCGTEMNR